MCIRDSYDTVAGFVMAQLGRLPSVGDSISEDLPDAAASDGVQAFKLTVTELDGRRAARIAVARGTAAEASG